ncbi:uncharacterized protein LOC110449154 isoform X2 [Mizuhopecten yessoensis]|uniref:uncharacterized protein LOC110449154 isoform X2 n=1 Tax=Mizuhopecten yessoensis TaxID=6573 RepID=UPI000B45D4A7|nr:uncharacterized protein LOC110449154 isoform X2 [Mizuhopecten yessoensis]
MMADVEIFSDEFFGFAVPNYSPTPEPDFSSDNVLSRISTLSVNEADLTPTGTTRRPTSGPVEHEMPHVDSDYNNPDTNSDASVTLSDDCKSVSTEDKDHTSSPTHHPVARDSGNSHIDTSKDTSENEINDCECGSPENVNEDLKERQTHIEFQLTRSHKENAGFSLTSSRLSGHTICVTDNDNSHVQHMGLQTDDSIVGVKNVDVRLYDHHILVSVLQHIYGEDSGFFKMVIGRNFETDDRGQNEVRYIEINVQFEFPTRGDTILRMTVDVVTCPYLTFTKIICVEFKGSKVCWIKNNDQHLSVQDKQLTTSNPFTGKSDVKFQFQWWTFHGLEARTVSNSMCPPVFFCAFRSLDSNTFVTVQSGNRVGIGVSNICVGINILHFLLFRVGTELG